MTTVRKKSSRLGILFFLIVALITFIPRAVADDDDPPSRVARLAFVQGAVSFQPAGTDDWVMARLNRPVTTGDRLWSDHDGRSELQLDGSLIRLSNDTDFSFLNLGDNVTQIQLTAGTVLVRVRRLDDDETFEIDTPNLAFSILRPGQYRISVDGSGGATAIRIRSGQGEVTGAGAAYNVRAGDSFTFTGTDQLNAENDNYGDREDQFEAWAADRDRHWEHSRSARYVSPDVVGYEDLDDHGSWRDTRDYGNVWFPRTDPDWAPYHYGHWAYIEPWGYTWVDDQPWGFAPFHYGRWVFFEGRWGWVPAPPRAEGVVYVRPVYAPALVAWVGGGGFAAGAAVAWFPLGPREVYVPSYRVSRAYVNNVNVSNTTVNTTVVNNYYNTTVVNNNVSVTNVKYVNQSVPGAVVATSSQAFTSAQPVAKNVVKVDERQAASAPVRAFTPAAVPAKQAVLGTTAAASAKPPAAVQARAVVAKAAPPPPPPPFEKRQEAIKSNGGKPLSTAQVRQIQPAAARPGPAVKIAPAAKPVAPPPAQANRPVENPAAPTSGAMPPEANRPAATNKPAEPAPNAPREAGRPNERPAPPNNANQPPSKPVPASAARPPERPVEQPNQPEAKPRAAGEPPQPNRPAAPPATQPRENPPPAKQSAQPPAKPETDKKQQQEQEQLRQKQEQEQQKIQQQQEQQRLKQEQQQRTDQARQQQQLEQQRQQQEQQRLKQEQQQRADQARQQQKEQQSQKQAKGEQKQQQEGQQKQSQEKEQKDQKKDSKSNKDERPPDQRP